MRVCVASNVGYLDCLIISYIILANSTWQQNRNPDVNKSLNSLATLLYENNKK